MAKIRPVLGLLLLLSLFILILPTTPALAAPGVVKWSGVNIPAEGKPGNWVLADGSDLQHLTMAIDGTLYCYARVKIDSVDTDVLFTSTDDGFSWSETNYSGDAITDIACSSLDADILYVTDGNYVYKSDDVGNSFSKVADASLSASIGTEAITCLDVGYNTDDDPYIFIGTAGTEVTAFGGVYCLPEADFGAGWTDLELECYGEYDVYSIACTPDFATNKKVMAVVTRATETHVISTIGVKCSWNDVAELKKDGITPFAITAASEICFPSDFSQEYEMFIGVVGTGGDVYLVTASSALDLGVNRDIISLDLIGEGGEASLMAGENGVAKVWYSTDGGWTWASSEKSPSGDDLTYVVMAPDFADSGKAYATTSGDGSAFSYTADGGITYNQPSLIDTKISEIVDLALSSNYSQDNTLFMVTYGGEHSLWRSLNGGTMWERVYSSALANIDSIDLVELSPQYGNGSQVVFIAGTSNGTPAIWKSTDNGQSFILRFARDPTTGAPLPIKTWAVVNDNTLFIGTYDGSNGLVYRTTNSGLIFSTGAVAGNQSLHSMALSPDHEQDGAILVGNRDGWVYWSNDNGISFEPLPPEASSSPLTGRITVAFAPQFSSNNTVYAASNTPDKGIYRFKIGTSTEWESIDGTLPEDGIIAQLLVSAEGVLYATNSKADGGMERCLNPTYPLGSTFETVTRGLDDGAKLTGLWLYDNQLWSTSTINTSIKLMTYTDSLVALVTLTSPPNGALGIDTRNVSLDWQALSGATSYQWQLDYDTDFSDAYEGVEGDTEVVSAQLPALELANTYYWRVRATEPVLSPWSAKWSFTTALGSEVIAPHFLSPEAGASGVGLKPVFQWSAIAGANSYELLVSTDVSLANPIIVKIGAYAIPSTAWQCDINLEYDTTYYWKVRASGSGTYSDWSAVSAFTTELLPELTPPSSSSEPPESSSSQPPPQSTTTPDWAKWLMCLSGALLLIMVAMLVTMVILTVRLWRL